jgi:ATP-dependent DNA ligase
VKLELKPTVPPMEARSVEEIPTGDDWHYEPKWDGFRCIAFRDQAEIAIASGSSAPSRVPPASTI